MTIHEQTIPTHSIRWFVFQHPPTSDAEMATELFLRLGGQVDGEPEAQIFTAYDSPDRRLAGSGCGLLQSPSSLRCIRDHDEVESPWNSSVGPIPCQVLPEPLAAITSERLGDRILLPLGRLTLSSWCGSIPHPVPDTGQAILPLAITTLRADPQRWAGFLAMDGEPGPAPFPPALATELYRLGLIPCEHHPLLAFIDQLSGPYPRIPLMPIFTDAAEPALAVMRRLVASCLARLRALEPGIIDDLDPSFLHQYRVTLRTTRSLCRLLSGVLDEATSLRLKTDLGDLAKAGNLLRDLDVHLVGRANVTGEVPPSASAGMQLLLDHLSSRRQEAQRALADQLRAPEHATLLDELDRLVDPVTDAHGAGAAAGLPIALVARQAAWKAWRTVRRRARRIAADTGDDEIHELRIRVKRLRYLLDVFGPQMAPPDEIQRLVERIKDLQTALGDYNDTANQLRLLLDLAHVPGMGVPGVLAAGVLVGIMTCRKRDQREALDQLLAQATGKAMRRAYARCLSPDEDG